jgi:hypothetical protein
VEYLVDIIPYEDEARLRETVNLMENLPLFEEEVILLSEYLEKPYKEEKPLDKIVEKRVELDKLKVNLEQLASKIGKEKKDVARRKLMKNQYWRYSLEDLTRGKLENAYLDYFEMVPKLINKFEKESAVTLIVGTAILMHLQSYSVGKSKFYEMLTKLEQYKSNIEDLPEIELMKELFFLLENDFHDLFKLGLELLTEKLVLFEPEIEIMNKLRPELTEKVEEAREAFTREELGKRNRLQIQLDQDISILKQMRGDVYRESDELLSKRTPMRKRYYNKIIEFLKEENFKEAGDEYFELAKNMIRRKDLQTASLMVLLHGLSYIKANQPLKRIQANVNAFLDLLGLNKRLIQETFYIRCIRFIILVKLNEVDKYLIQIQDLLDALPIFEEEKPLLNIAEQI